MTPTTTTRPERLTRWRRDLRRAIYARRRFLAAVSVALAVGFALSALAPPPAPTVPVVVAARDLAGGQVLAAEDVEVAELPPEATPSGVAAGAAAVVGRTLAAPMRAGEPLTDIRLLGPRQLDGYPAGHVLSVVRVDDPTVVRVVAVGDRIDVLAVDARSEPWLVADGAVVTAIHEPEDGMTGVGSVAGLVVAVPGETALDLAAAAATSPLTVAVTGE